MFKLVVYTFKTLHGSALTYIHQLIRLKPKSNTVELRYKDPRYNDIPGITMNMLCPGKVTLSEMYGTEPRYNDLRYNDIPDITMCFRAPSVKSSPI